MRKYILLLIYLIGAPLSSFADDIPIEYFDPANFHVTVKNQFGDPVPDAAVTVYSWLNSFSAASDSAGEFDIEIPAIRTSVEDVAPRQLRLNANYPNPFNPSTTIEYELPEPGNVRLDIFNILGQQIRTLVDGWEDTGMHQVTWDGRDDRGNGVGAGLYLYRLQALGTSISRKMLLIDGNNMHGGTAVSGKPAVATRYIPGLKALTYYIKIEKEGYETFEDVFERPSGGMIAEKTIVMQQILTDPPVADAGPDRIAYAGSYITITGSGEARDGRVIQGYNWYSLEDSTKVFIAYGNFEETRIASFPFPGVYYLTMNIYTDGMTFSEPDTMKVTVLPRQESPIGNPVVEIWIRFLLNKPEGTLTMDDLAGMISFNAPHGLGVTESLEGLENCVNLENLSISYGRNRILRNISAISELGNLTSLSLSQSGIEDISPIMNLTNLKSLSIGSNPIHDLSSIAHLSELEYLYISYTINDGDITSLSTLHKLTELRADGCNINDLTPLTNIDNLTNLTLNSNEIEDISPLLYLEKLEVLYIRGNPLNNKSLDVYIPTLKANGVRVSYF